LPILSTKNEKKKKRKTKTKVLEEGEKSTTNLHRRSLQKENYNLISINFLLWDYMGAFGNENR
jgi:hypothetical protein